MALPTAVILGFVILGLGSIYLFLSRTQAARGKRFEGTLVARHLAAGACEFVAHLMRDAADPGAAPGDRSAFGAKFRDLLLLPAPQLRQRVEAFPSLLSQDHRGALDQLLGGQVSPALEGLAADVDATVQVWVSVEVGRYPGAPEWLVDSVAKSVRFEVSAEATYGPRSEQVSRCAEFVVYPLLDPLVSRFTSNGGFAFNDPGADISGAFDPDGPVRPLFSGDEAVDNPDLLETKYANHGWAYPLSLAARPGGDLGGQDYLLWMPEGGRSPVPEPIEFEARPPGLTQPIPEPPDPQAPDPPVLEPLDQEGFVTGLVQFTGQPGLDSAWDSGDLVASAWGRDGYPTGHMAAGFETMAFRFGTSRVPSPTYAPGSRMRLEARSALVVDRDHRGDDERAQRVEVGDALPRREAVAYQLGRTPNSMGELDGVMNGGHEGGDLPHPPAEVPNRNLWADTDGDGEVDTPVRSEEPYPTLRLDRAAYAVPAAFDGQVNAYAAMASRPLELPLSAVHALGSSPVEASHRELFDAAWRSGEVTRFARWAVVPERIDHQDKPREIEKDGPRADQEEGVPGAFGKAHYFRRATGDPAEDLARFVRDVGQADEWARWRWHPHVVVEGEEELKEFFPDGDLRGHRVIVVPEDPGRPMMLEVRGERYRGGVLSTNYMNVLEPPPEQEVTHPLTLEGCAVYLHGDQGEVPATVVGGIVPLRPQDGASLDPVLVRGSTRARRVETLRQFDEEATQNKVGVSLATQYDGARNPTGVEAHKTYRVSWVGLQ